MKIEGRDERDRKSRVVHPWYNPRERVRRQRMSSAGERKRECRRKCSTGERAKSFILDEREIKSRIVPLIQLMRDRVSLERKSVSTMAALHFRPEFRRVPPDWLFAAATSESWTPRTSGNINGKERWSFLPMTITTSYRGDSDLTSSPQTIG